MMNDMRTWIYLKSDNPADALALSSVISHSTDNFYIVRRSVNTFFFNGQNNITVDYYPNTENDQLVSFDEIPIDSWQGKCKFFSENLNITTFNSHEPYLGFSNLTMELSKAWGDTNQILLYLFPHPDQKLDLMVIDELVRIYEKKGLSAVSGGTNIMPCIKNTKDLRQLISISEICELKDRIAFILTSEMSLKTIGEALGLSVYVISDINELTIDGMAINDANQAANYIEKNNKSK